MKPTTTSLAALIDGLPEDWALVGTRNKKPIDAETGAGFDGWQLSGGQSRELLKGSRHHDAVGALCGPASGGLLVIDFDGAQAAGSFKKLTGFDEQDLPLTVACASGKPSRKKLFFNVPDRELHGLISGVGNGTAGLPELEVLWTGRQAVVCGAHPETAGYSYLDGCSPDDLQVAEAPVWLVDALICERVEDTAYELPSMSASEIEHFLSFLNADDFGGYPEWSTLGMAVKVANANEDAKDVFQAFSKRAPDYDEKVFHRQWNAWASVEQFKNKRPGKRPRTLASFYKMAAANGFKAPKTSSDGPSIESIVKAQTDDKYLKDAQDSPNLVNLLALLRHQSEVLIRWDELKRCIVIGEGCKVLEPVRANVFLADQWKINAGKRNAEDCVITVALENSYNPVREYFEDLRGKGLKPVSDNELAECFGLAENDQLSIQLMRIHLRACAGRGMNPGQKLDSLLVLEGDQGNRKSTSVKTLSPDSRWYDETTRVNFDSRDALSSLNSAFIYEFSEIEKILTTADVAQFKSWISREVDNYCEKHEKTSLPHVRRCCLFGTTNAASFLMDPTGARRFFICKNTRPANIKLLAQLRDALWHQSLIELEKGLPSFLSNDDELFIQCQERAQNATIADPWEAELSGYLYSSGAGTFLSSQSLLKHLGKATDKLTQNDFRRLGNIMRRMGWIKTRKRLPEFSNPVDGYCKPETPEPTTPKPTQEEQEEIDNIF
jgi:predicted P-loop ATPase